MYRVVIFAALSIFLNGSVAWGVSFSADVVTPEAMGMSDRGKFYFKESNTFRTDGMGMININKGEMVYAIVTDTKKYVVMTVEDTKKENPIGAWGDAMDVVKRNNMKKVGKEVVSGYSCVVYEGKVLFHEQQPPALMKMWYSKKIKNMIKQEVTMMPLGKIVTYLENIKIGKQEDSLFEVPQGYTKVDDMAEAMGMGAFGGMQMPGMGGEGEKNGQMPSEEDMKKMMEQMQSMMKKMEQ